jgi:hypothetical protein
MPDTLVSRFSSLLFGFCRRANMHRNLSIALAITATSTISCAQSLSITYGAKGVQTLSYAGTTLEDVGANPSDSFHIWHIQATDLDGNVLGGWGEVNSGESWNASSRTETYNFPWGSVATQFVQAGNNLNMIVTETNLPGSGTIIDGVEIYPFALHFPQDPVGFSGYSQYAITTIEPGVSAADYGSGVVTSVIPNESVPMYGGWKTDGVDTYTPVMTATAPDGLATFLPSVNQPVPPGSSFTYTVSLRFTPEGASANAGDAYASFAATYPNQMNWKDRRIIGTAYLASSPSGSNPNQPGGFPTNPRRYFNDPTVNITTAAGLQSFQDRILQQAENNVSNAQAMSSQGVITWDIEGEEYPQSTTYVCSPDQIATVAPEMESTVLDGSSPYYGQKLDDSYFAIMRDAGLRVGVCLRPQVFTLGANTTASQVTLSSNSAIIANLENKARYANQRWSVTLFYVDSTVDANGGTLDPAIFQQLITDLPTFLFIPEESTPRYYAYSAPFYSFIFHTTVGTDPSVYNYYPNAFGANLVNDVSATTLAQYQPQLTQAVAKGDILMGHADYWQANDPTLVAIYKAAGASTEPPAGSQTTPTITWPALSTITYGTPLSATQLDASATVPGTFVYSPPAGTVLNAGTQTVIATFTPSNNTEYKQATASASITVNKATPVITWPAPAAITSGTALTVSELDATANVPGSFAYSPAAGTVPATGTQTLSAAFTPSDSANYTTQTASVSLLVNASAASSSSVLAIVSPAAGATVSGQIVVTAVCNLNLDSAGSYLMVDGVELPATHLVSKPCVYPLNTTTLTNGPHVLQVWAHDTNNVANLSPAVTVEVNN